MGLADLYRATYAKLETRTHKTLRELDVTGTHCLS